MNEKSARDQFNVNEAAPNQSSPRSNTANPNASRFEKFAATQAAGDGIQGDANRPDQTIDEKIAANMADRK